MFVLDSRLEQDTLVLCDFPLCRLLLMNDAQYPWFILVPRREEVSELFQLDAADQQALWRETTSLAETVKDILRKHYVHRSEAGLVQSTIKERGRYKVIDQVSVSLNEKTDAYEAVFESLGIKRVAIDSALMPGSNTPKPPASKIQAWPGCQTRTSSFQMMVTLLIVRPASSLRAGPIAGA